MKIIYCWFILFLSQMWSTAYCAEFDAIIDLSPRMKFSLPVSGVINKVNVKTGQRVRKGDEMLSLDSVPFIAAKARAQSGLEVQEASLVESQRDLKNQRELYDRTVLATVELENAELRVKRDQALLDNAKAQLAEADYAVSYSKLNAPFDALVVAVKVNEGQSISNALQSKALITLVKQGEYQAGFYVSADVLDKLDIGKTVIISVKGSKYQGNISTISYVPVQKNDSKRQTYMVTASFTAEKKSMFIGDTASVQID